jgi:hypothetical protein
MRIKLGVGILVLAGVLGTANGAAACGYGMAGPFQQFLAADFIIVGKVKVAEDCTVWDVSNPAQVRTQTYKVVTIEIGESLKGAQGLSAMRVGFQPGQEPKIGTEGCFYLSPTVHTFSTIAGGYLFPLYRTGNPDFDKSLEATRQLSKLWENPTAGLRSRNEQERLLTAGLVLSREVGRFRPAKDGRVAAIDGEQGQLILQVLADADWSKPGLYRQSAPRLFSLLGLTDKDGWKPPEIKTPADHEQAAKAWLKAHIEKHHIGTVVATN